MLLSTCMFASACTFADHSLWHVPSLGTNDDRDCWVFTWSTVHFEWFPSTLQQHVINWSDAANASSKCDCASVSCFFTSKVNFFEVMVHFAYTFLTASTRDTTRHLRDFSETPPVSSVTFRDTARDTPRHLRDISETSPPTPPFAGPNYPLVHILCFPPSSGTKLPTGAYFVFSAAFVQFSFQTL